MSAQVIIMVSSLPLCLAVCAAMSSLETALFSLTYHDRMRMAKSYPRLLSVVDRMLARPRELLVTNLLVNMIASTLYMVLTTLIGMHADHAALQIGLAALNLLAMTLMAEVISKMLAARYRVEVCRLLAPPLWRLFLFMAPVRVALANGIVEPLARLLLPGRNRARAMSPDELKGLLDLSARQGAIQDDEVRLLSQVIALGALRVRDLMTHRVDMEWIDETATAGQVRSLVARTRLTRVPVCRAAAAGGARGLDAGVLGLLNTKRYLAEAADGRAVNLMEFVEPAVYVPEATTLDRLLQNVRGAAVKVGLCVDEHGTIVGVVAAQDVVRRLVTEVTTRTGEGAAGASGAPEVRAEGPGRWSVPGRQSVREWAQMFGLPPDPRVTTVAGYVMAELGRPARVGDAVVMGNLRMEVTELDGMMIERVGVSVLDGTATGKEALSAKGAGA